MGKHAENAREMSTPYHLLSIGARYAFEMTSCACSLCRLLRLEFSLAASTSLWHRRNDGDNARITRQIGARHTHHTQKHQWTIVVHHLF